MFHLDGIRIMLSTMQGVLGLRGTDDDPTPDGIVELAFGLLGEGEGWRHQFQVLAGGEVHRRVRSSQLLPSFSSLEKDRYDTN